MLIENLERIKERLNSLGRPDVRIIAVSKTHGPEKISELLQQGHRDFGENRFNEARDKLPLVKCDDLQPDKQPIYHHIGPLQSGNARQVPRLFQFIHGVSSFESLEILERSANSLYQKSEITKPVNYLIQLRLTAEESKAGGMTPDLLINQTALPESSGLHFCGLMTMGPQSMEPLETQEVFHRLRELRDSYFPGKELSMGMSGDWEIAVKEGSNMIRIGTQIFGKREAGPWKK